MPNTLPNGRLVFASVLEKYFLSYMITQRKVSKQTIASYRDSFRLFIGFLKNEYNVRPEQIEFNHLGIDYLITFCNYLENCRNCKAASINIRLAAIKSFLRFAIVEVPECSNIIRKSLKLPARKTEKAEMTFLTKQEYETMLTVCDRDTALGLRDKLMLMILYNTGCRVSELIALKVADINLHASSKTVYLHFLGKGRKERNTPVWKTTATFIKQYVKMYKLQAMDNLFGNRLNENITRSGVGQRISAIAKKASQKCPSMQGKKVTPHTFRHTTAMNLLQAGIDISTIAIWLGHESIETTHKYMVADIELKRKAMEKLTETANTAFHYKPSNSILDFLKNV